MFEHHVLMKLFEAVAQRGQFKVIALESFEFLARRAREVESADSSSASNL